MQREHLIDSKKWNWLLYKNFVYKCNYMHYIIIPGILVDINSSTFGVFKLSRFRDIIDD